MSVEAKQQLTDGFAYILIVLLLAMLTLAGCASNNKTISYIDTSSRLINKEQQGTQVKETYLLPNNGVVNHIYTNKL